MIRHLHDLARLKERVAASDNFAALAQKSADSDTGRGGDKAPATGQGRLAMMLDRLRKEAFWVDDYDQYVRQVSFAKPGETMSFAEALEALESLASRLQSATH